MKICQNCGMEYGDDNSFFPFCDERYGSVILVDDVISADGLPLYKEEFPIVGEISVKQESFADNRDKIYKRNIRLAAKENFLPKMEARAAYKPVVPLAEIGRDGVIAPYKPPNPVVKKIKNIRTKIKTVKLSKTGKAVLSILSVAAIFLAVLGVSWFEATDVYADYQYNKRLKKYGLSEEITVVSKSGLEMNLNNCIEITDGLYVYDFEFKNVSGEDMQYFWNEFTNEKYGKDFDKMEVLYLNEENGVVVGNRVYVDLKDTSHYDGYSVSWIDDGIEKHTPPYVHAGDTVIGYVEFDFMN